MKKTATVGKSSSHNVFLLFLVFITLAALVSLSVIGWSYYFTPVSARPFRTDYQTMKPSGVYSQGLGIIGSAMVIIGVGTYSSRKRIHAMWKMGSLSRWLEFHIVLCLIGPVMIVYHTTFKAGGIAAISLWSMLSVVASGIIGRFLYVQIPRNIRGHEMSQEELDTQLSALRERMTSTPAGTKATTIIDQAFQNVPVPTGLSQMISTIARLEHVRHDTMREIHKLLTAERLPHNIISEIQIHASAKISLLRKTIVLKQIERLFFYWHAIHLPFTIIMFITLAAHITVAYLLGYRWIF